MFLYKINKIKLITAMAVVIGGMTSCEDFLNEVPESEISPKSFYQDNRQLQSGLVAAYSEMSRAYSSNQILWGELRSDNLQPDGDNISRNSVHNNQMSTNDEDILSWKEIYRSIDFINRVINEGEQIDGFDPNIVGQAYAMRAKAYFDLARVWGNIPVFTESVTNIAESSVSGTPANEVIQNVVIPDMLRAESLLSVEADEFTFSKSSVYALQGEVYLWENQFQLAKVALEKLLSNGQHRLVSTPEDWQNMFLNNTAITSVAPANTKLQTGSELIFSFNYKLGRDTPSSGLFRTYVAGSRRTAISVQAEESWKNRFPVVDTLWNQKYPNTLPVFQTTVRTTDGLRDSIIPIYGDWRLFATREGGDFIVGLGTQDPGEAKVHKWHKDRTGPSAGDDNTNIVIYRLADVILMLSEAELQLGNTSRSLELINQIRTARQLPLATLTEFESNSLDFLLDERRFELFGEGKRWWDLLRNNKAEELITPILEDRNIQPLTSDRLVWPIWSGHLRENPKLEQNSGWAN